MFSLPLVLAHVLITLVAIGSGALLVRQMLRGGQSPSVAAVFLGFTALTSITGFVFFPPATFPPPHPTPAQLTGVIGLVVLIAAFAAVFVSPSLLVIQGIQVVRRVAQYAIARPSREMCFTVVEQVERYKAKNVIDTVVYRFGDVSAAWVQTGMRALGSGLGGVVALGLATSALWAGVAVALGRRFAKLRRATGRGV